MTPSFPEELVWLMAQVRNVARRHGMRAEEVCDALIDEVCWT